MAAAKAQKRNVKSIFPKGYCQLASKLLAKFLVEAVNISQIKGMANGKRPLPPKNARKSGPTYETHFWLEYQGYVIDITADQFDDFHDPIFVSKDRRWHEQFLGQSRVNQDTLLNLNEEAAEWYQGIMALLRIATAETA